MKIDSKYFELYRIGDATILGETLLLELLQDTGAREGCIYYLQTLNNKFVKQFFFGDSFKDEIDFDRITIGEKLHKVVKDLTSYSDSNEILVPFFRNGDNSKKYCIGFIHLKGISNNLKDKVNLIETSSVLFIYVYKTLFLNNLLKSANHPIDFKVDQNIYLNEVLKLISNASGFPYIALREYDKTDDSLKIISNAGFSDEILPSFESDQIPTIFKEAIITQETIQSVFEPPLSELDELKGYDFKNVIVIPIVVGSELWGTMSLATKCEYHFNSTEVLGLEMIGHGIGVSINNYRNFNDQNDKTSKIYSNTSIITGLEIAQAVRHEAKNLINESQLKLISLKRISDKEKKDDLINEISNDLKHIHNSLDKIKTATKPPERVLVASNLKVALEEVKQTLQGRLDELRITVKFSGNFDFNVSIYLDWFRHAFLNLLLNSIDSFKEKSKKGNREISISIEPLSVNDDYIRMTYSDNAGGIILNNLKIPDEISEEIRKDMNRIIFEPNVTSKGDEGSGYGLALTRLTIQNYHKGTIDLTNYRNGVTFKISIYKNL